MRIDRVKFATELIKQDMTQKRLSELSGVSRTTIGFIKSGKTCSIDTAQRLADALGTTLEQLTETK